MFSLLLAFLSPLFTVSGFVSLLTLSALEVVLGVDNIVVLTILVMSLPAHERDRARRIGLNLALILRILLLLGANWMVHANDELFSVFSHGFSLRDLLLIGGGLFLTWKAATEIYLMVEVAEYGAEANAKPRSFWKTVGTIAVSDVIFALDSVVTAVGMAGVLVLMIAAVVIAVLVMKRFAGPVGEFIERHASVKMLALGFLFAVGAFLIADGMGHEIEKGFLYGPMIFAALVETLNMRLRSNRAKRAAQTRRDKAAA